MADLAPGSRLGERLLDESRRRDSQGDAQAELLRSTQEEPLQARPHVLRLQRPLGGCSAVGPWLPPAPRCLLLLLAVALLMAGSGEMRRGLQTLQKMSVQLWDRERRTKEAEQELVEEEPEEEDLLRVYVLRHGEKLPAISHGLSPCGKARAQYLADNYGRLFRGIARERGPVALYARNPAVAPALQRREVETLLPLGERLEVRVNTRFDIGQEVPLAADVLSARSGVAVISWEHCRMPRLLQALGCAAPLPGSAVCYTCWPDREFDHYVELSFSAPKQPGLKRALKRSGGIQVLKEDFRGFRGGAAWQAGCGHEEDVFPAVYQCLGEAQLANTTLWQRFGCSQGKIA